MHPSVRLLTFSFKQLLLKNKLASFNQTVLETWLGIQICSNKGVVPFLGPNTGQNKEF